MADSTSAVASPPVSAGDLERAENFVLEPFLLETFVRKEREAEITDVGDER